MDVERARYNMVESQIRTWEVLDQRVLDTLLALKREEFVPEQYRLLAFVDMEIPIGHGEVMLAPKLEARLLQELTLEEIRPGARDRNRQRLHDRAAGGHGRARLQRRDPLRSLGRRRGKACRSRDRQRDAGGRVTPRSGGSGTRPTTRSVFTGSVPVHPGRLPGPARPGGRLLAVVGDPPAMTARLTTCVAEDAYNETGLFETCIVPLRNAPQPERFVF